MRNRWIIFFKWYVTYAIVSTLLVISCGVIVDLIFGVKFSNNYLGEKHFITMMMGFAVVFSVRLSVFRGPKFDADSRAEESPWRFSQILVGVWYASIFLIPIIMAGLCYFIELYGFIVGSVLIVNTLMLYIGSRDAVMKLQS